MCGLVGFISKKRNDVIVEKMLKIQAFRGPDDNGIFVEKVKEQYIHFGHNRLSIQDPSAHGHQPFVSVCGNYIIVFNGEVYNFKAIRLELELLGYKFISDSDTEVILYAYKEWGIKAVDKFIGMFAFSILDKISKKVILLRDRAGVKPLYYYACNEIFVFASELKSFHEYPDFHKQLNLEVLPYYFQLGYIPAPHTVFKHTYKLRPGHYLEYDLSANVYEIFKYWSVDEYYRQEKFDQSEQEILGSLESLMTDAVNLRMVADVPVGIFLSGGYDSSLVTALLSQDKTRRLHTFTIGFNEKKYNEAEHAKKIARYFNTEHSEYYVSKKDMLDRVYSLPFFYDEPFGDSSSIPTMIVSELAKQDVTVALSADGGDEAFCGYSKYFFLSKFEHVFSNSFKKTMLKSALNSFSEKHVQQINEVLPKQMRQTNVRDKYNKFKRAVNADSLDDMFRNASSSVDSKVVARFLNTTADSDIFENFSMQSGLSFIDKMMLVDYKTFMVDDVLTKVDRATMSVSLEGREPLLDHRIIEFMAKVPTKLKYKNNQGKYLPRQILYKHIPQSMIDKPKAGFQVPLAEWLRLDLRSLVDKYLDVASLDMDIFNVEEVKKIKNSLIAGDITNINTVWFILMFEMWKEKWF